MRSESLRILEPCSADWEQMDGDDSKRFCRLCKKNVHDLSTMSEEEAGTFLASGDQPCIRYVHDAAGDIVFKDRLGLLPRLAAAAALAFAGLNAGGCLMGKPASPRDRATAPTPSGSETTRAAEPPPNGPKTRV